MPETTVRGVSLYSEGRNKNSDVFELSLTYDGIVIRRPGEEARHLAWDRITEWEIEQRRGGVLLILRGGGSVTPLVIPKWKVDDLDVVLRDVTNGPLEQEDPVPAEATAALELAAETEAALETEDRAMHGVLEDEQAVDGVDGVDGVEVVEVDVMHVEFDDDEGHHVVDVETEMVVFEQGTALAEEVVTRVLRESAAVEHEAPRSFEEVVTEAFSTTRDPDFEVELKAVPGSESTDVDGTLVWPNDAPLERLPDLEWPSQEEAGESGELEWPAEESADESAELSSVEFTLDLPPTPPAPETPDLVWPAEHVDAAVDSDFMAERLSMPADVPSRVERAEVAVTATTWVIEEVTSVPPQVVVPPPVVRVSPEPEHMPANVAQPTVRRRRISLLPIVSVVLLAALAVAVALVLAQSAGLVHLGFLGSPG